MKSSSTAQNAVVGFGPPARAGHAAGGVDDDAARLDQPGPQQRGQGQRGGGDVAAGRGDQGGAARARRGTARAGRRRSSASSSGRRVVLAVPLRVERGVLQAEVGGQVDDRADPPAQVGHERPATRRGAGRGTRGRGRRTASGRTGRRPGRRRRRPGSGRASATGVPAWVSPVASATSSSGWPAQQPQQLGAGVARRADDADRGHRRRHTYHVHSHATGPESWVSPRRVRAGGLALDRRRCSASRGPRPPRRR